MHLNFTDNPHHQFLGPITALTILLKQQRQLSRLFPTADHITENIIDLLYGDSASVVALRIAAVEEIRTISADEAQTLDQAFIIARTLTKEQQDASLIYMNFWLAKKLPFLIELNRVTGIDTTNANSSFMEFYANPDTFVGVRPIAIPTPAASATGEEFDQRVSIYNEIGFYQQVEFYQRGGQEEFYQAHGTMAPPPTPEHQPEPILTLWRTSGTTEVDAMENDDVVNTGSPGRRFTL